MPKKRHFSFGFESQQSFLHPTECGVYSDYEEKSVNMPRRIYSSSTFYYPIIEKSGYCKFPPRLPEQPIFYPVLNERYATEIASGWNVKYNEDHKGYGFICLWGGNLAEKPADE